MCYTGQDLDKGYPIYDGAFILSELGTADHCKVFSPFMHLNLVPFNESQADVREEATDYFWFCFSPCVMGATVSYAIFPKVFS